MKGILLRLQMQLIESWTYNFFVEIFQNSVSKVTIMKAITCLLEACQVHCLVVYCTWQVKHHVVCKELHAFTTWKNC